MPGSLDAAPGESRLGDRCRRHVHFRAEEQPRRSRSQRLRRHVFGRREAKRCPMWAIRRFRLVADMVV